MAVTQFAVAVEVAWIGHVMSECWHTARSSEDQADVAVTQLVGAVGVAWIGHVMLWCCHSLRRCEDQAAVALTLS